VLPSFKELTVREGTVGRIERFLKVASNHRSVVHSDSRGLRHQLYPVASPCATRCDPEPFACCLG